MIIVLSQPQGAPRILQAELKDLIGLARLACEGTEAGLQQPGIGPESAWAGVRRSFRHARLFANPATALHYYRFGRHGLDEAEVRHIVQELVAAHPLRHCTIG
jgi:hypothetical protein